MAKPFLGVNYWRNEFAVTDGDLNRLAAILRDANGPIQVGDLLRSVVEYKLAQDSLVFDPLERVKSALAAGRLLGEATIYHPTGRYRLGQQLYVARRFTGGEWQIGCGTVVNIDRSQRWSTIELEVPDEPQHWFFVCEVPSGHEYAVKHLTPLSGSEQTADDVLDSFGGELLPHLHGRLAVDPRFVSSGNWWWLANSVRSLPAEALGTLHRLLLSTAQPLAADGLLAQLGADWPDAPGNRFSLNRALLADPDRFRNTGTVAEPRWQAILPTHVVRLADGTLFDLSLAPDALWAEYSSLFARAIPDALRAHPDTVHLYGHWLLRPLLIPFDNEDLEIVRAYLEEACEARTDAEILADFGRSSHDDDWPRWRFSLAWALHDAGDALGIEFVGTWGVWRWALRVAPMVQPDHHRPIRGRDGLPVKAVPVEVDGINDNLSLVEPDEPEPEPRQSPDIWTPMAAEWSYTLTYYDWQHGILPYAGGARAIIPPLAEDQQRALLYAVAPQVSDEPFAITSYSHERTPWLYSKGLLELCQGFHLVPGARIRLLRTEHPDRFMLLYNLAPKQTCRALFFEPESLRPHIQEITFACEVDPDMLLAESRFTDIQALDRLYRVDRRTAPKVLANIFEVIGEHDDAEDLYRARFGDLFPLLCVTKPYSRSYVQQILARSHNFPWFYPDRDRPGDWHVYDPKAVRQRSRTKARRSEKLIPDLGKPDLKLAQALRDLESDPDRMGALANAIAQYRQLPGQVQVLVLRAHAHEQIRKLLAPEALPDLRLDAFDRQVWQFGHFEIDGRPVKWGDWILPSEFYDWPPDRLQADLAAGRVKVQGNATWGSATHVYGAQLRLSDAAKLTLLKRALTALLYGQGAIEHRIAAASQESNGLGLNVITGMLHALWPDQYTLFNSAAVTGISRLLPGVKWERDVQDYPKYQQACKWFMGQEAFGFENLTDLDWFVFNVSKSRVAVVASEAGGVAATSESESPQPADLAELWIAIQKLAGERLHTLGQEQTFVIQRVSDQAVYFQVEASGRDYQAGRNQIAKAWEALARKGHLPQAALRTELGLSHPVYIASILSLMPGVTHTTGPVILHYAAEQDATVGEASSPQEKTDAGEDDEFKQIQQIVRSSLAGQTIHTLTGKPNQITQIHDKGLTVVTEAGEAQVMWQWIEEAYDALRTLGTIERKDIREGQFRTRGGFRSAFIFGLLAQFAHIEARTDPRIALTYHQPEGAIALRDTSRPAVLEVADTVPTLESEPEPKAPSPTEHRRDGQALIPGMPLGPIFDGQPAAEPAPVQTSPGSGSLSSPVVGVPPSLPPSGAPPSLPPDEPPPAGRPPRPVPRPRPPRGDVSAKRLFSHHYLEHRLAEHPEWKDDPQAAFGQVRALWQTACQYGDTWNEAQTEDEFVRPVLKALGWAFTVQPKATKGGQLTRPDYALFADDKVKKEAQPYHGKEEEAFYSRALAIAEAKYWGRPLSQTDKSGRSTWKADSNPSHQMVSYLVGTRVPWGILTNGRVWRLYSREVSSTASEFYEVDLGLLFDALDDDAEPASEQLDQFRRWWLFFRRQAFTPDPQGRSFVQRVHEGSATYARQISDKLKELVFEQVVPEIAGGFVAYRSHQRGVRHETDEGLREIYAATLSLLYKLLFLLYAEARSLLPMDNAAYREQSLTAVAEWAADRLDKRQPLSDATHATARYEALLALFHRVDQGDPSLGIPRYNGGLFSAGSPDNRFLEEHKLSDAVVARAVDTLVRDAGQPVDYAYISVRNLGAIYEGLLENKLRVVNARAGQVELVNDKGERKASGSYYTPDYIVEYIVQHTLDPILGERQARFEAAMDRGADLRRQLADPRHMGSVELLRGQLDDAERDAREAFLGIKVCDPAMGSGHFLVNAVDHLTDGIIQRMQTYHDAHPAVHWDWNPIQQLIDRVRGEIVAEMGRQGIDVDPERLDDTALLTRLVMKRCIYGVDLNPLAVELAKLSLWLHSFTVGAPLSFLDHHLRWGNSLIGTDVRTVEREIQRTDKGPAVQLGLFAGPFAGLLDLTAVMTEVAGRADATLADVRQSADKFAGFQQQLTPYKQVLDLWVSRHFDNKHAEEFLTLYSDAVLPALRGEKQVGEPYRSAIERARALSAEKRFFHWDLEFPEVFVDLQKRDWAENPGFDAVVGNPPYDELSEDALGRKIDEIVYLQATLHLAPALGYRVNLYRLFVAQALHVVRSRGWQSFIVPLSLLGDRFALNLRKSLLANSQVKIIEQFPQKDDPHDRVFPDAKLSTCLYVTQISSPTDAVVLVRTHPGREIKPDSPSYGAPQADFARFDPDNLSIPGVNGQCWDLVLRLAVDANFGKFGMFARALPGELMINRQFEPYLTDSNSGEEIIRGSHIAMYELVEPKQGEDLYLDRAKYLGDHVQSEKASHHKQERVVYQRYAAIDNFRRLIATILPSGFFCSHTVGYLGEVKGCKLEFLLALLNSRLLDWRFNLTSTNNNINGYEVEGLPVPLITFSTPDPERHLYLEKAQRLHARGGTDASVTEFVAHHMDADRTDVVHDLLAFLAEQMIAMNKDKQPQLKAFRLDLGGYLDQAQLGRLNRLYTPAKPPEEGIKNYAQKQSAYEQASALARAQLAALAGETLDLEDFWRLNEGQWQYLVRQRLGDVANMSKLVGVYEQYHASLAPLMRRLQRTDQLIDQVVYRLYGLTEEEIAIVEGR